MKVKAPETTYQIDETTEFSPVFIGGAGRSGTTLLRVILDSHPNIVCGPEIKLTPTLVHMCSEFQRVFAPSLKAYYISSTDIDRIFASFFMSFVRNYIRASGKKRFAEKTPNNVFFFRQLAAIFPRSPLIQVIRDGRDVVCSLLTMNWIDTKTGKPVV